MTLTDRDRGRLKGVHPDLVRVVERAAELTAVPFTVLEGLRSKERQQQMVAAGSSTTLNSRHLTGHAVDIAPLEGGKVSWAWPLYHKMLPAFRQAGKELNVELTFGADWKRFKDGPHIELKWSAYPA
jgi:peptidoglycan L-alanyl-D-glutamate endopeptidase CwlK